MLTNFFGSAALTLVILMLWVSVAAFTSPAVGRLGTVIAGLSIIILGGVAGTITLAMVL